MMVLQGSFFLNGSRSKGKCCKCHPNSTFSVCFFVQIIFTYMYIGKSGKSYFFILDPKQLTGWPCCSACRASAPPGCPGGCSCPPGTSSSPGPRSTTATGSNLTTAFDQCWAPAGRDKWSFSFKMKYVCYYFMKENPRDLNYIPRICWGNITNQRYYFK